MKKYLYITSNNHEMNYCSVHDSKEVALKYTNVKRLLKVEVDIPNIEEDIAIAEEEDFVKEK